MRNYFVLRLKLTFPTPTATAFAIRALHAGKSGAEAAKQKGRWLFWSFLPAFVQKVASTYAPGILYDIHFFYDIATWGGRSAQYVDNWGWCAACSSRSLTSQVLRDHPGLLRRRHPLGHERLVVLLRRLDPRVGDHRSGHGRHRPRCRSRVGRRLGNSLHLLVRADISPRR